jgi:RNA-splicing ligase RtcB
LGRKEAKRKLSHKQQFIDNQMRTVERKLGGTMIRGIVGNTNKTPLDECDYVYKKLDDVLAVLENEGIAEVKHRMWPVANLKGTD